MKIRIGSRESRLAVIQAELAAGLIRACFPDIETELVTMKTTGDLILDKTLDKVGGKGLFLKELEQALLDGRIDIAVHSYKDVPMELDERLPIVAVSAREDPRDALVLPENISHIDFSRPIGCSSLRRGVQLKNIFPACEVAPIRGNVQTRLAKLDRGEFSAIALAYAGLKRLGLSSRASRVFGVSEMIPAACQGIIAVQARADFDRGILEGFNDRDAWDLSVAERGFVSALNGGCGAPVAAYGELRGDELILTGLRVDAEGRIYKKTIGGRREQGLLLGRALAEQISTVGDS